VRAGVSLLLLLLLAGLGLGCGASDRAPRATAERFQTALADRDGAAACAELSAATVSKLEQQAKHPCARAILGLHLPAGARVADTSVYVTSASVSLADGDTLFLDEASDGWEVSAAGCRPTRSDLPFDCELED
jgi:hypothetical protein